MPGIDDKFEEWLNSQDHGVWPTKREVDLARKAFIAGVESTKEKRFGCHIDEKIGEVYFDCGFDHAKDPSVCPETERLRSEGKSKTACRYWREIED